MRFESPQSPFDDILNKLDSGEIIAGDKGIDTIVTPDGTEVRYQPEFETIYFPIGDVRAEFSLRSQTLELSETVSGKRVYNQNVERQARFLAKQWNEMGLFSTKQ